MSAPEEIAASFVFPKISIVSIGGKSKLAVFRGCSHNKIPNNYPAEVSRSSGEPTRATLELVLYHVTVIDRIRAHASIE